MTYLPYCPNNRQNLWWLGSMVREGGQGGGGGGGEGKKSFPLFEPPLLFAPTKKRTTMIQ